MIDENMEFNNEFVENPHKKIYTGIQQLYLIGLYDALPVPEILSIFKTYLSPHLFYKLKNYVTSPPNNIKYKIHWPTFKSKIDNLPTHTLQQCAIALMKQLENLEPSEKYVKTFHIFKNNQKNKSTEPNQYNTTQMIQECFSAIYQRNVLASLIKYILLEPHLKMFKTSQLTEQKRGIFYLMQKRLEEIVEEHVLVSFNGQNYDNYLICNSLILIQTKLRQPLRIFKKGASISSILCINKTNFFHRPFHNQNNQNNKNNKKKPKKDIPPNVTTIDNTTAKDNLIPKSKTKNYNNIWPIKLYIKDIRNLVAANMSLDKIGKLFNLPVSKLVFPYSQATTISKIKKTYSLHPNNDMFWKDSFQGKSIPLEKRLDAQQIFETKQFDNLYDFGTYYLIQDCVVLHSIVLTLFKTYLNDSINIFIRRNYSQSSLAYQQFFILEPSKQIDKLLAPKSINNTFYNYLIKQAVTGGLCTSFVHGKIDENTQINEHFNYMDRPNLNTTCWPNFSPTLLDWNKKFVETPSGISTLDIRSLYPSASVKKIPVHIPLFYSRFTSNDFQSLYATNTFYPSLNIKQYCTNAQQTGNFLTDTFKLVSRSPTAFHEFYALAHYLQSFKSNPNIKILRFQSEFTAMGQLTFGNFKIDGFLSYLDLITNSVHLKLIQYQSVYFHGHMPHCSVSNTSEKDCENREKTIHVTNTINQLCCHLNLHFKNFFAHNVMIEYVEISDCDFVKHYIPKNYDFIFPYQKNYQYQQFLQGIYNKTLTGLLVVKNLQISKQNHNPIFGFIIQKIEYGLKHLSPYTQTQASKILNSSRVISVHSSKNFMVISTDYFLWLYKTFGFETPPDIYHALLFQLDDYLKNSIETKLLQRKNLKKMIKNETNLQTRQNLEVKAELIKLMLNSCYGYTLCNISSSKFKQFETRRSIRTIKKRKFKTAIKFAENIYLVEITKKHEESFPTLLGHVGCFILFQSKKTLLKRLYFLLQFFNPQLAQLLYMDTDSAHFLVKFKNLEENVHPQLRPHFQSLFNKHFETGPKISGIWVEEGFYECGEYLAEKCYRLYNKNNTLYLTHMKGLNAHFQHEYHTKNIDSNKLSFLDYNIFFKSPDFLIFKTFMSKNIFDNYVPNKRYFVSNTGSLPLKL
jgi:hypothetical protein